MKLIVTEDYAEMSLVASHHDAPRDKCGYSGAINHGHTFCYM